jgi:hypothetical protein
MSVTAYIVLGITKELFLINHRGEKMYHNEIYSGNFEMQNIREPSMGYVRVLHAVPDAPNVDVYANDKIIAKNLAFGENTPYTPISAGNYEISLYVAGKKDTPVMANRLVIGNDTILTVAAVGTLKTIGFLSIPDSNMPMESGKAMVRFAHLSPNAPAVDITLPNGTILFRNVSYKQLTPYISVPPMNYTLQVRVAGTPNVVLTVPNVNLEQNKRYTVYAVGLVGQKPELEALLLLDK